jgi:hypothetical protein
MTNELFLDMIHHFPDNRTVIKIRIVITLNFEQNRFITGSFFKDNVTTVLDLFESKAACQIVIRGLGF